MEIILVYDSSHRFVEIMPEVIKPCKLKPLLSYTSTGIPHLYSTSKLKMTLHVLSISYVRAKPIILLFMFSREESASAALRRGKRREQLPPEQLTQVIRYFWDLQVTWGLHITHLRPWLLTNALPIPGQALSHLAPKTWAVFFPLFKMHQWFPFNTCSA